MGIHALPRPHYMSSYVFTGARLYKFAARRLLTGPVPHACADTDQCHHADDDARGRVLRDQPARLDCMDEGKLQSHASINCFTSTIQLTIIVNSSEGWELMWRLLLCST